MKVFIHDDFLLGTPTARRLYHEIAERLPIIDYHGHLDPHALADDRRFENLADAWIAPDPYKHRAMRIAGVAERLITGDASPRAKFDQWAAVVPQTVGNPLFHWTALELKRTFGIDDLLAPGTADSAWLRANDLLRTPGYSARGLIERANVECLCTSDRLLDDLAPHARLAASTFRTRVLPSLRADDLLALETSDYTDWLQRLARATSVPITGLDDLRHAVRLRLDAFDRAGCRLADHALDDFVYLASDAGQAERLFARRLAGDSLSAEDLLRLKSALLRFLAAEYGRRAWVMQLHLGAQRQTSTRLRRQVGPAGGYASIGRSCDVGSLCRLLDELEIDGLLPHTILYTLNPADNAVLATLTGSFTAEGVRGKLQFGPAWWYNDHRAGIVRQLDDLANFGLLSTLVGMTTDSRCLLSMTRHEYFRRVLCDYLGTRVESGEYPADDVLLGQLVGDVCYRNASRWIFEKEAHLP
jgi:glucuronate isomerase